MKSKKKGNVEFKNVITNIVNGLLNVVNIQNLKQKVSNFLDKEYMRGLEDAEINFDMNFKPQKQDVEFLQDYAFQNIQRHTDEIGESLRGEVSRGIMEKESISQIKTRIKNVFKDKKFEERLKMVMRTEALRANNTAQLTGAQQSGIDLKKWLAVILDNRTSNICKAEHSKYGSPDKAITLNKEFVVKADNKTIRAQKPPFHPNCRSVVMFRRANEN